MDGIREDDCRIGIGGDTCMPTIKLDLGPTSGPGIGSTRVTEDEARLLLRLRRFDSLGNGVSRTALEGLLATPTTLNSRHYLSHRLVSRKVQCANALGKSEVALGYLRTYCANIEWVLGPRDPYAGISWEEFIDATKIFL